MAANHLFDGLLSGRTIDSRRLLDVPGERDWSYADLVELSGKLAHLLLEQNVKPGDRVMVQVQKSPEAIALYLATIRAGAVFLPLNTAYTRAEVGYFLQDAEPAVFVCDSSREADYDEIEARVWTLDSDASGSLLQAAWDMPAAFDNVARESQDLAAILYTSGTTGLSKGAMLSHDNLLSNALTLVDYWRFTADDVLLHALPIFHTHGLFVATNVILIAGASMILLPRFDVDQMIAQLPAATTLMGVPTFYTRLLADDRFDRDLVAHMRLFVSGSAPMLAETHIQFEERTGHRILERYGMTETNMNTSNPYDGERRVGSVGFPLPGVEIRISDPETGAELSAGETGMIEVRGPNVFLGYWRKPEKTALELRNNGFFISGDLGMIDADGYVHILGREKDLVISGGYNIYPKQIETEIDALDGVLESAVFGIAHPDLGEAVAAAVVPVTGTELDAENLIQALEPTLARFKLPRQVFIVDELPRNAMGKVQKNILRANYG
ncbi:MAG: malonyl-CoA synthase [Gammaproteobacteria bacterium]|nr:malonyl-CoA synthase [Gammaproteobacteria bacterium]MDH3857343.1 malonyl-CoA synthase [Gammaproteobacteria bacterium]